MKPIDIIILAMVFWMVWMVQMILLTLTTDFRTFIYGSFLICILVAGGISTTSVIKE